MKRALARDVPWREGDPRLTNGVLVLLGVLLVMLAHQFTQEIVHFRFGFDTVSLASVLVYLAAVLLVRTQPVNRTTMVVLIALAVPMFAATLLTDPYLSSDIYRYVWDGMVQHHFINPYRYVPGNPVLSWLREPNQEIFDNINRRDYAPTIYPPVAQMIFWFATYFAPSVEAMKLLMLAFIALTAVALGEFLRRMGRSATDLVILLWCPLMVWEVGCAGHVDAAICGLLALALLFRLRLRPGLCGLFLGLAVMTKFYPLLLLPALYQRRDWKMPATVGAVCVAGYALYSSVGWRVLGFLQGYSKEEGIDSGSRFFLLDWVHTLPGLGHLPKAAFTVFSAAVLGLLVLWAWWRATPARQRPGGEHGVSLAFPQPMPAFVKASLLLAYALMLLFSPHYAWYNLWLVPLMVLLPSLPSFCYPLAFYFGYTTALAARPGPLMFLLNERIYLATAIAFVLHLAMRRWPLWPYLVTGQRRLQDEARWATLPAAAAPVQEESLAAAR